MLVVLEFSGKVVGVNDGDTITVMHGQVGEKIRLNGIDCPERGQPYGKRAKQAASAMAFGKEVTLETYGEKERGQATFSCTFTTLRTRGHPRKL